MNTFSLRPPCLSWLISSPRVHRSPSMLLRTHTLFWTHTNHPSIPTTMLWNMLFHTHTPSYTKLFWTGQYSCPLPGVWRMHLVDEKRNLIRGKKRAQTMRRWMEIEGWWGIKQWDNRISQHQGRSVSCSKLSPSKLVWGNFGPKTLCFAWLTNSSVKKSKEIKMVLSDIL